MSKAESLSRDGLVIYVLDRHLARQQSAQHLVQV